MTASARLPRRVTIFERGWLSSNNILFKGRDLTAMVDSGYVTHSEQTVALVRSELGLRPLDLLINTHLHSDHAGGNAALQESFPDLQTHIPPGDAAAVTRWDESALSYAATGQECPAFRFQALLKPGEQIALGDLMWEIHSAPGHDPNSILLFEPESRVLISADALWEKGFGVVFPELAGDASFEEVGATLDLIERLSPLEVIPGHGGIFTDVSGALAIARSRLDAFSIEPRKHARHALKVLVKFKLLQSQRLTLHEWEAWTQSTPYLDSIRRRFFDSCSLELLCSDVIAELVVAGVAAVDDHHVMNR